MAQGVRNDPTVKPMEDDYLWAAGFMDAEGYITVVKTHSAKAKRNGWNPTWFALASASQVDPRPLQWLQQRWGGAIRHKEGRGQNDREAWEWTVAGQQAYPFLEGILPFLKAKDTQARNALRLRGLRKARGWGQALTTAEVAEREEVRAEALRLNREGQYWREPEQAPQVHEQRPGNSEGDEGDVLVLF